MGFIGESSKDRNEEENNVNQGLDTQNIFKDNISQLLFSLYFLAQD